MAFNPQIMQAVERLNYRVTVGDIATAAGLDIDQSQAGLLALAAETNAHLQVSETGEIAYLFPPQFRNILRQKYLRLRLQAIAAQLWKGIFFLIRMAFGIFLVISILLILLSIAIIVIAMFFSDSDNSSGGSSGSSRSRGGGSWGLGFFWSDLCNFFIFNVGDHRTRAQTQSLHQPSESLNFFEAIFSFLFGDGNPNANLELRRNQLVGQVIQNAGGAIAAEQIAPFLAIAPELSTDEAYMLPVLSRLQGYPEVSPVGDIVYRFPALQISAADQTLQSLPPHLVEREWAFSRASTGQISLAIGLGMLNLGGAICLKVLLGNGAIALQLGGLVAFVASIFWVLLTYGVGFLGVPLVRYFWQQGRNQRIRARNQTYEERAIALSQPDAALRTKLQFAQQFATKEKFSADQLAYTTETDLLTQESERSAAIDAEWNRRLQSSNDR
jgi:hypothetical protein